MPQPITVPSALLQALLRKDSYGLELIDLVNEKTGGKVKLHQGSVYPALRALEDDGLVTSYDGEPVPERGGRPRRYYKLTGLGVRAAVEDRETVASLFELEPAYVR